jgi:polyphosphate kinase
MTDENHTRRRADDDRWPTDLDVDVPPYEPDDDGDLRDPELYINRELSELAFQRRVLEEALDESNPILERVRFLSIVTRNLDEFVMKRIGGLKQQIEAGVTTRTSDGRTPESQWEAVHERLGPLFERQDRCYHEEIRPTLAEQGIHIESYDELSDEERAELRDYFEQSVLPTLTPLSFDPAHPFPFISNRSLSLAVLTRSGHDDLTFTRVKIPPNRPRLVPVETRSAEDDGHREPVADEASTRYVLIEDVIRENVDVLLPNAEIVDTSLFRLTRNAEVRRDEEVAEDLTEMIEEVLEERRFASVVRLEVQTDMHPRSRELLKNQLSLDEREIYERHGPLDYRDFEVLTDLDRPELKLDPWTPQPHSRLHHTPEALDDSGTTGEIFADIRENDVLLHHPYHDFGETVQRFLDAAANDPQVLAVKAAIYRTASDSQVIESLIRAAENGKQVAVMVELKARFDEQNNLEWVRKLEEHGIHVAYGTVGLKTHTKTALVVREDDDGVRQYAHVGTGNYHSETAKGYVDLGLLTADSDIGQDLVRVFNFFTGPALDDEFRKLLIAPVRMREEFTAKIRREAQNAQAGEEARIVAKVNGLEDPGIVEELYRAAMAGVDIDLIVRDICRLRPGLTGISESVNVYSVVGRFLEHSRIFYFANAGDPEYFLGSADWMHRNLDNRVEAVVPVEDPALRRQLKFNLELLLHDTEKRWEMQSDGSYRKCTAADGVAGLNTQETLMRATARAADADEVSVGTIPALSASIDSDLHITGDADRLGELSGDDSDQYRALSAQLADHVVGVEGSSEATATDDAERSEVGDDDTTTPAVRGNGDVQSSEGVGADVDRSNLPTPARTVEAFGHTGPDAPGEADEVSKEDGGSASDTDEESADEAESASDTDEESESDGETRRRSESNAFGRQGRPFDETRE